MLLRHTLLYLPAQIVGPLFQLVAVIVWTHIIDEHALGVVTLVTAIHELLQTAFLAWWSQYTLRFVSRFTSEEDKTRFRRTENAVLLGSIVLQGVLAVTILILAIDADANPALIMATVGYVISRSLNLYIGERARAAHAIGVYSVQQITGPMLGLGLGYLMIEAFGQGPEWPLAGYALAQFGAVALVLPLIRLTHGIGPIDPSIRRQALAYGVPLIAGNALTWAALNASRFVTGGMLGVASAGLFAVGYGLGQRAATVPAMLVTAAAFPIAVRHMERGGSRIAMRQLADNGALLAGILLPSVVGVFMLRGEIVRLLIAGPFQAATLAILPLAVLAGAIRNFRAHFGDQVFLLHDRTRIWLLVVGVDGGLTVLFSAVCTALWGLVGAAAATVAATIVAAVVSFSIGWKEFSLQLPWAHLARIGFATMAMTVVLQLIARAGGGYLDLALNVLAGALTYFATLAALYAPKLVDYLRLQEKRV
ncbi:MAG TPA: lipopolysaccharide biosynthesis protein [Pseudolabrys sp.]|nr:lipopolysaccharide biosynthesis protein [Pseudolabrys sp.]